jgi:hypothetical protein
MRIIVAGFALLILSGAAHGADPTVDVIPAEITARTLTKDAPLELEVRLKAGDRELTAVALSTFSNDGIGAEVEQATPAQLPKLAANAEYAWRLKLTRVDGSVLTESTLHVKVAFDVSQTAVAAPAAPEAAPPKATPPKAAVPKATAPATPAPTHRLIYATAKIKPQAVITAIELAKAEIKGAPESLAHERPSRMFVIITNEYSRPLTVTDVKTLGPTYIDLEPAVDSVPLPKKHPKLPMTIRPGEAGDLDYTITAKNAVVPGKYLFIATVDVMTEDKLAATVRTPPQEINVVVLGESDVLKYFGIPSLLFLPGVLMLIAWRFLWAFRKTDDQVAKYRLQWNTSDFWVVAITLSLGTALIYPWLTESIPQYFNIGRRNFVAAYGLLDFSLILGFALLVSILAFGMWRIPILVYARIKEALLKRAARKLVSAARKLAAETIPGTDDTPLQILEKLAKAGLDSTFQQYYSAAGDAVDDAKDLVLALEKWSSKDELWLIPPMQLTAVAGNSAAVNARYKLINAPPDTAAEVRDRILEGIKQKWWSVPAWHKVGFIRKPTKAIRTDWTKSSAGLGKLVKDL